MDTMLSSPTKIKAAIYIAILFCVAMNVESVELRQDFDSFKLVLQWPGSYDRGIGGPYRSLHRRASNFSIHGLWPTVTKGKPPIFCNLHRSFDPYQISDLTSKMELEWPSFACPTCLDPWFWELQWEKHGTCSESVLNQHAYFAAALRLKETVDLLGGLKKANIVPDEQKLYDFKLVLRILTTVTGIQPGIQCNKKKELYQIHLCVDKVAFKFINCTSVWTGQPCFDGVKFPPLRAKI